MTDDMEKPSGARRPTSIEERARVSRTIFEENLQRFVLRWAPLREDSRYGRDDFQRELMMLLRDAMHHQSHVYGLHVDQTSHIIDALSMHATAPLNAIFKEPPNRPLQPSDLLNPNEPPSQSLNLQNHKPKET